MRSGDPSARRDAARLQLARAVSQPAALADGRAKLFLLREALRFRRAHGPLMLEGEYVPLVVDGPDAAHVVAFARRRDDELVLCVVPRLLLTLVDRAAGGAIKIDARVHLPETIRGPFADLVTGKRHDGGAALHVAALLADFPVALLTNV